MSKQLEAFETYMNTLWEEGLNSSLVLDLPNKQAFTDKRLVAIYLSQVYHYAVHTPRHQALVAVNPRNKDVKYMQYCFEHALEETGHELMALHDIQSMGFQIQAEDIPAPLTSTSLLISYLYREAENENPVHHLGYGFWSENACPFINEFMDNLIQTVRLHHGQMTFYSNHVSIDKGHAHEVRKIIEQVAKTDDDWKGMRRVAKTTFDLTLGIVRDSIQAYEEMIAGEKNGFEIFMNPQE